MIFISLGTQNIPFTRILAMVDDLIVRRNITEEIIAQTGHTNYHSSRFRCVGFIDEDAFREYINKASFIISHAGSGALFSAIKSGKKAIAVARLKEYNEMPDNHQTELVKKLSLEGYILDGTLSLVDAYDKLKGFFPRPNDFSCSIEMELYRIFND